MKNDRGAYNQDRPRLYSLRYGLRHICLDASLIYLAAVIRHVNPGTTRAGPEIRMQRARFRVYAAIAETG